MINLEQQGQAITTDLGEVSKLIRYSFPPTEDNQQHVHQQLVIMKYMLNSQLLNLYSFRHF